MIYRIVYNETMDLYGPESELSVIDPSLEVELNSAGTLTFTLPKDNIGWDYPNIFKDEIEVWEGDKIIWFGRPLEINRNWKNEKVVTCEGALAYFNDSIQRTKEIDPSESHTNRWFFQWLVNKHNAQVSENRKIFVGNITIDEEPVYRELDYDTTANCLQSMCLDTDGGYFILRKAYDSETGKYKRYIDWVKEMPNAADQPVQFGLNMLDISQDLNGADVCTVLIPTCADDVTLAELGNKDSDGVVHQSGSDEISYTDGIAKYGRVISQKSWNDISDINELWRRAKQWLIDKNKDIPTIECSAADLHYLTDYKDEFGFFEVGSLVRVISEPHDISRDLTMYKISMELDSGIKKITIGTPPKRELTDIVKTGSGSTRTSGASQSNTGGGSGGGSGSGGTTNVPVKKVKVNNVSVVKNKTADIKVKGGDNVTVVTDSDTGEVTISASGNVQNVQVNGVDILDSKTHIANIQIIEGDNIEITQDSDGKLMISSDSAVTDVKVNNVSVLDQHGVANVSVPVQDVQVNDVSVMDGTVAKIYVNPDGPVVPKLEDKFWKLNDINTYFPTSVYQLLHNMSLYPDHVITISGHTTFKSYDMTNHDDLLYSEFTVQDAGYYICSITRGESDYRCIGDIGLNIYHNNSEIDYLLSEDILRYGEDEELPELVYGKNPVSSRLRAGFVEAGDKIRFTHKQYIFQDVHPQGTWTDYTVYDPQAQGLYVLKDETNLRPAPAGYQDLYYDYDISMFEKTNDRIDDPTKHYFVLLAVCYTNDMMWCFRIKDYDKTSTYFKVTKSNREYYEGNTSAEHHSYSLPMVNYYVSKPSDWDYVAWPRMDQATSDMLDRGGGINIDISTHSVKIPDDYPNRSSYIAANGGNFIDGEKFDYIKQHAMQPTSVLGYYDDGLYLIIMMLPNDETEFDYGDRHIVNRTGITAKSLIDISSYDSSMRTYGMYTLGNRIPYADIDNLASSLTNTDKNILVRIGNATNHKGTRQSLTGHYAGVNANNILCNQTFPNDSSKSQCGICDSIAYARIGTGQELRYLNDLLSGTDDSRIYGYAISLEYYFGDFVREWELDNYAEISYVDSNIRTLQANFQDGVDDIYDACVSKGSTPTTHALADVVTAIENIETYKTVNIVYTGTAAEVPIPTASVTSSYSTDGINYISNAEEVIT